MRLWTFFAASALLLLPGWTEVSAVPVHLQALPIAGSSQKGVIVRLIPQSAEGSLEARSIELPVPGEESVDLPGGTWQVLTESPSLWSPPEWIAPAADSAETRVTLRLFPAASVSGQLKAPPGEALPASLDLRLEPSPDQVAGLKPPLATIQCPVAAGRFRCVVPVGRLDLRLRAGSLTPVYLWDVGIEHGKESDLGTLSLKAGASVVGWLRTEDGKGVNEALVRLAPQTLGAPRELAQEEGLRAMARETRTNRRGFFQLEDVSSGMFVVNAEKEFSRASRSGIEVRPRLEAQILDPLVLRRPVSLRLILDPPTTPSGLPWNVAIDLREGPFPEAGPRGDASMAGIWEHKGLSPGKYTLYFKDGDTHWHAEDAELIEERTVLHIDLSGLQVRGRVLLGDSPLKATLAFHGKSPAQEGRFQSDEEGRFEGRLSAEGTWEIAVVSEAERLKVRLDPVVIRKAPGKTYADVDIRVPDTRLQGSVVDEKGQAVPRASLAFITPKKPLSKVATDEDGKFDVRGLPPGSLFVHAVKDEMESDWLEARIEEERDTPELKLTLRSRQTIQGRVYSSNGPVPGAQVSATAPAGEALAGSGDETITGPAGEFTLKLPAGISALHLSVLAPGYATRMLLVPLGADPLLEIPLETVGGSLVFDLGDKTPGDVLGAGLLVHGGSFIPALKAIRWTQLQRVPQPDPHRLVLPNMEAGEYLLCAGPESYQSIPRGLPPPAHQCSQGTLAPLQELVLPLPFDERFRPRPERSVPRGQ